MWKNIFYVFLFSLVYAKYEIYDGHSLYVVSVKDVDQAKTVNELEYKLEVDVWTHALPDREGLVLVPKEQRQAFETALDEIGVEYNIKSQNIREQLELEDELLANATVRGSRASSLPFPLDAIHRYDVIDSYLVSLADRYPNRVKVLSAGRSVEGRDIKYLQISTTNFQDTRKPVVMIESLLHCREWIGLAATLYAIDKLVVDVTDPDLVKNVDWIILPISNPDGYEHTHANARFWRKNRASNGYCTGVDLNRNFDIYWSTASSNSQCSDTYHGRGPSSEPETQAIVNLINKHKERMEVFFDIHSFGSLILYGYGNGKLPSNYINIHRNGVLMAQTIDSVKWPSNRNYRVGNVQKELYAASGSASDFAQSVGATFSYTLELPAYNNISGNLNGFLVDPNFIPQAGFETWEGIKAGVRFATSRRMMGQ